MASGEMGVNAQNIPHSALYTAATWKWLALPCAELTTPESSAGLFKLVTAYNRFYRRVNPAAYSLPHMLAHRHAIINALLTEFIDSNRACGRSQQIIEIAAGFSPRGAHRSEQTDLQYFEVDLPNVIEAKRAQLAASGQGQVILARPNLTLLAGNVLQLNYQQTFKDSTSFIITEGLMMYFERHEQQTIWQNIAGTLEQRGGSYVFDYIPKDIEPKRSALGRALHWLKTRLFGEDKTYSYDNRSSEQVRQDLLNAGFQQVDIISSDMAKQRWALPHTDERTDLIVYHCR